MANVVVSNGVTNWTCAITPPSSPYQYYEYATAVDNTMVSTTGLNNFRCVFGFQFDPSRTQVFQYSVNFNGNNTAREATITGQYSTGALAAAALQTALNAKEAERSGGAAVSFTVSYDSGTEKFTISYTELRATVTSFTVNATIGGTGTYQRSAMSHFGWQHGASYTASGSSGSLTSTYAVKAARFKITYSGLAGSNRLSNANWTAKTELGFTGLSSDVTIKQSEGAVDMGYTITSSVTGNGTIDPEGSTTVSPGASQGYAMLPDAGNNLSSVVVDGSGVGRPNGYLFQNVNENHTIVANFTPNVTYPGAYRRDFVAKSVSPTIAPPAIPKSEHPQDIEHRNMMKRHGSRATAVAYLHQLKLQARNIAAQEGEEAAARWLEERVHLMDFTDRSAEREGPEGKA